jgi:predicted membrane GTPase involved in stress response
MLGFRQPFLTVTRGTGIFNSLFHDYEPMAGPIASRSLGSLVALESGRGQRLRAGASATARHLLRQADR